MASPDGDMNPSAVPVTGDGPLRIRTERRLGSYLLAVAGELDLASLELMRSELNRAEASDAERIIIDLSGLEFIDVAGMACLLEANRRFEAHGGRLGVLRGSRRIDRLFEMAGLDRALPFID